MMQKKIALIAENCPVLSWDLEWYLQDTNWEVISTYSLEEVFLLCEHHLPDLIFMPCGYHHSDRDIDIANSLRRNFQIPIIFLTANDADFLRCQDNFYHHHEILFKPFCRWQLKATIAKVENQRTII